MRILGLVPPIILLLGACASPPDPAPQADPVVAEGAMLVRVHCADCHAVGRSGRSKHPEAVPFHRLSELYPVEGLEEALAEGIVVGHPEMPEFRFRQEDAEAIVAYLQSIQPRQAARPTSEDR